MPITSALTTNQVKDRTSTEVEFNLFENQGSSRVFRNLASFNKKHQLSVQSMEVGAGLKKRRRSVIRISKEVQSDVDTTVIVEPVAYIVVDSPVGALTTNLEPLNVLAELGSFCFTAATTTVVLDGSNEAQKALVNGDI